MSKKISDFEVLQKMAIDNKDIALIPPSNFKGASMKAKDNFGTLTMSVDKEYLDPQKYAPVLYMVDIDQFKETRKELEKE